MPKKPASLDATAKNLGKRVEALESAMDEELNERELRFVEAFVRLGVKSKAVIEAGYSAKGTQVQAARLLGKPRVLAAIAQERAELSERTELKTEDIVKGLQREAHLGDTASSRVRAWEQLARIKGLFVDKLIVEEQLSPEQRASRLAAIVATVKARQAAAEAPAEGG